MPVVINRTALIFKDSWLICGLYEGIGCRQESPQENHELFQFHRQRDHRLSHPSGSKERGGDVDCHGLGQLIAAACAEQSVAHPLRAIGG